MRPASLLAAGALTLAAGLAACGPSSSSSSSSGSAAAPADPAVVLTRAYSTTVAAKSADVAFSVKERVGGQTVDITGTGAFDWGARQGTLRLSFPIPGQHQTIAFQEVVVDGAVYAKFPPQIAGALGMSTPWIKVPLSTSSAFSAGPDQTLQLLASKSTGVTPVGPATIDGVATTEYRGTVDPSKLSQDLPAGLKASMRELIQAANVQAIPIEAWVDSAGRAVRIVSSVALTAPVPSGSGASGSGSSASGAGSQIVTTSQMDFSHYGTPVPVTAPPADQVGSSPQLEQLFGG